jgi:hypothetical protein
MRREAGVPILTGYGEVLQAPGGLGNDFKLDVAMFSPNPVGLEIIPGECKNVVRMSRFSGHNQGSIC